MRKAVIIFLLCIPLWSLGQYKGTGSVTHGMGTTTNPGIYSCAGGRIAKLGTIKSSDSLVWALPAAVNFTNTTFHNSSDLHNVCTGKTYANSAAALAALTGSDIITIDSGGELITAYIFADNYFEMYINGTPVGKDNVPYTQFNSSLIRFRANRPFSIAMLLVDWEEYLGLGAEVNGPATYHDGDGGMVAVFKDSKGATIAITDNNWKAQTYYTAPITDLSCPTEVGNQRLSGSCSTKDTTNGSGYYGLHWARPSGWMNKGFNDANWPAAVTYTNATVGVDNKPAYTNFLNIFDDPTSDAQFIWSSNLILDNEVLVRYTVPGATGMRENKSMEKALHIFPNPSKGLLYLEPANGLDPSSISGLSIHDMQGRVVFASNTYEKEIDLNPVLPGVYFLQVQTPRGVLNQKFIME